jgi:Velvet factor
MTYSGQHAAVPRIGSMYASYMDHAQQQYSRPPIQPPPITIPQQVPRQHQSYHQYNMSSTTDVEASPSQGSDVSVDRYRNLPTPAPISKILEGKAYLLEIVQQPLRARMCGFGDKVCCTESL